MVKKIKKHDLLPWFLEDHGTLPASYLEHCRKFFDEIKKRSGKRASEQAVQETVPYNDIEEANKPASSQAIDTMGKSII